MANYKRKKCRYAGKTRRYSLTGYRVRCGLKPVKLPPWDERFTDMDYWPDEFNLMRATPASWNILYHVRPHRALEKRLARDVRVGRKDPENIAWLVSKKPHCYYW